MTGCCKRRRNQYTGAINFFKDRFAGGSHTLKIGGEYLDEKGETIWNSHYADNVIHFVNGSLANGPRGGDTSGGPPRNNADSWSALATTSLFVTDSWVVKRLTLNVGARFDRYRVWLPEQSLPAGRFVPAALTFEQVSDVVVFNHIVPRIGASYDLLGDGKHGAERQLGTLLLQPGRQPGRLGQPQHGQPVPDRVWNDLNNDRIFQEGEEGVLQTRFGGVANAAIDPELENAYTDEASVFVERAVLRDLGVRVGYVYKKDKNGWQQVNILRPFSAYNVPVTVIDPGPDGDVTTTADNAPFPFFNLDDTSRGSSQLTHQHRRLRGHVQDNRAVRAEALRAAVVDERLVLVHVDARVRQQLREQPVRHRDLELRVLRQLPVDAQRVHRERFHQLARQVQRDDRRGLGTIRDAGAQDVQRHTVRPLLLGRRLLGDGGHQLLELRQQLVLVEPTRHQAAGEHRDPRHAYREEDSRSPHRGRLGLFLDIYNALNADTLVNINWRSGTSFEKATTVVGPRILKFGVKFDW